MLTTARKSLEFNLVSLLIRIRSMMQHWMINIDLLAITAIKSNNLEQVALRNKSICVEKAYQTMERDRVGSWSFNSRTDAHLANIHPCMATGDKNILRNSSATNL